MSGGIDPIYVRARGVLLDALAALKDHREAVLLVGAQAIYLHTGEGDLAVAPYTTDADLAINPAVLANEPRLEALMREAGFVSAPNPAQVGTWLGRGNVPVDLMVPEALGGAGRRAARLGQHGSRVARKARGLEAALVDNAPLQIGALEPHDVRRYDVLVAGPSALLVAKLHKIEERRSQPTRQDDKDALDVYRLLRAVPLETFESVLGNLLAVESAGVVTEAALRYLEALFRSPDAEVTRMVARSVRGLEDEATVVAACAALADEVLEKVRP